MHNITVFAVLVIIVSCISVAPVFAEGLQAADIQPSYAFSFSPQFGFVWGHAEEIVYATGNTVSPVLSELLWNMKPVFYYGFLMDLSRIEPRDRWGFFTELSLKFGIPAFSGRHENRDWMSVENSDVTHFSRHSNFTRELFLADLLAGCSFPLRRAMLLKAYVNVSFMRFSFTGNDGTGTYAYESGGSGSGKYDSIDDNSAYHAVFDGTVISYTQEWFIAAPGVSFGWYFYKNCFGEISFLISPLVLCADMDEHKERNIQYRDYIRGGIMLEPGIRLSVDAGKWLDISWELAWRYIALSRGITYWRSPIGAGTYVLGGEAGAGLSMLSSGLYFRITL